MNNHTMRLDQTELENWIARGSRILDLGCGDGTLLKYLRDHKDALRSGNRSGPTPVSTKG